jgi:hypothetical protein
MKQPRRFNATPTLGPEGRLMAIGREERPDPAAKLRVAHRLGISAATLATVAATATITTAVNAAAGASAKAVGSFGAALANATGSFITATLAKATMIGIGLGIASYAGVKVYTARSLSNVPSVTTAKTTASKPAGPALGAPGTATETSAMPDSVVEARRARANTPSSVSADARETTPAPSESTSSRDQGALPVGRFEDEEPKAVLPSAIPGAASASTGYLSPVDTNATQRASAWPVDLRLAREVASLDVARASAKRGDAAGALRELTGFQSRQGYLALRREAMIVNIDVLLSLERRAEAAAIARQLLRMGAPATQRARLEELVSGQP